MNSGPSPTHGTALAVILAAGKGTRMNSDLPKVLCPVVDRPMIHFVLDAATRAGIGKKVVVIGYEKQAVRDELQTRGESDIVFAEQNEQLGTGHAVQMCREHLEGHDGLTLVIAGDSPLVQSESLKTLIEHFEKTRPALLLGTLTKDDPTGLGRIVRDDSGQFTGIVEHKDATEEQRQIKEVNMSTYLFSTPDLLWALSNLSNDNAQGEYYLTDCARLLNESGRAVEALPVLKDCESLSINNPEELKLVDQTMRAMGYA
ncbi:bifunctional UDP-N-acetylglucosamine pyrophosphorylase/glucosamine-1-phosphate N-acetyltransferase/UDP-N-acetylglucosamine pyrophosphorylase [Rhodopirellula rubra]|uniref:Bifunctional UDP-N-acetylglucosamine pyrophosphorylase/glucosamine-1-phosphate N-acetyltransferase/UDP-N-acetylglucosamine pyrophosphorylase n=1 Tax=Aporhodopirellula rubra TaxID=980271 RepID=A0A7W5E209_9BACT|nr:sugar phosphate nucleotidyltransferase [Aporhodopirellula rubra]MBB3208769.1 bifunctional UDP-N-acetylglucosamine pyrophosphorylase/glucosamine-1-phosphate N-acetyltransferase/UDP-N-acetylglucosamine pyrophosphorylase [Aporhodopirellula rubra]